MRIEDEVTAVLVDKNKAIIDGLEMYNMLFEKRLNKKVNNLMFQGYDLKHFLNSSFHQFLPLPF